MTRVPIDTPTTEELEAVPEQTRIRLRTRQTVAKVELYLLRLLIAAAVGGIILIGTAFFKFQSDSLEFQKEVSQQVKEIQDDEREFLQQFSESAEASCLHRLSLLRQDHQECIEWRRRWLERLNNQPSGSADDLLGQFTNTLTETIP